MKRALLFAIFMSIAGAAHALSALEFMRMKGSEQYDVVKPMLVAFLGAGYRKVPDNEFTVIYRMREIIFEKGYVYQNVNDIAKEAALSLGMVRSF